MDKNKEIELRQTFVVKANELKKRVANLKVINPASVTVAVGITKEIKAVAKEIDDYRDGLVRPHNDFVKQINALAKALSTPFVEMAKEVASVVAAYNAEQLAKAEKLRKEQEALEAKRLTAVEEERQKRLNDEIAKRKEEEAKGLSPEEIEAARQAREDEEAKRQIEEDIRLAKLNNYRQQKVEAAEEAGKVKGMRTIWTYEVIDPELVDKSFCSPDSVKINAAIKTGLREASGLRIFEKKII